MTPWTFIWHRKVLYDNAGFLSLRVLYETAEFYMTPAEFYVTPVEFYMTPAEFYMTQTEFYLYETAEFYIKP